MSDPSTVLQGLGLAGVVISAMAFVITRQYNDNKTLQAKYDIAQDARRVEIKELADKAIATMNNQAEVSRLTYDKIRASKES